MNKKTSIITIGVLAIIGLSVLGYQHYTQETDGKYFSEWHSLRTDSFKAVRRNFSPLDDMAKERISFQPELIKKYSANLAKATQPYLMPLYGSLRAQNHISYSSKSRAYRKTNKRDFIVNVEMKRDVILLDDIVTTGCTLEEAHDALKKHDVNVLFALVLADAKEN